MLSLILCSHTFVENTKLKDYVNKPLTHFDYLRLIVGDDFVKGDFMKTYLINLDKIPFATILVTCDPVGDQRVEDESVQYYVPNNTGESGDNSGTMCRPNPLVAGGSKVTKARRKKQVLDEDIFDRMVDKVGDLSNTIRKTKSTLD